MEMRSDLYRNPIHNTKIPNTKIHLITGLLFGSKQKLETISTFNQVNQKFNAFTPMNAMKWVTATNCMVPRKCGKKLSSIHYHHQRIIVHFYFSYDIFA